MAESKYKIGDTVTIKKRVAPGGNYKFFFTDEMAEMAGKKFVIVGAISTDKTACIIPDDGFEYTLYGEARRFSWASSMFEESNGSINADFDVNIDAFIRKRKCPELDFSL